MKSDGNFCKRKSYLSKITKIKFSHHLSAVAKITEDGFFSKFDAAESLVWKNGAVP